MNKTLWKMLIFGAIILFMSSNPAFAAGDFSATLIMDLPTSNHRNIQNHNSNNLVDPFRKRNENPAAKDRRERERQAKERQERQHQEEDRKRLERQKKERERQRRWEEDQKRHQPPPPAHPDKGPDLGPGLHPSAKTPRPRAAVIVLPTFKLSIF